MLQAQGSAHACPVLLAGTILNLGNLRARFAQLGSLASGARSVPLVHPASIKVLFLLHHVPLALSASSMTPGAARLARPAHAASMPVQLLHRRVLLVRPASIWDRWARYLAPLVRQEHTHRLKDFSRARLAHLGHMPASRDYQHAQDAQLGRLE